MKKVPRRADRLLPEPEPPTERRKAWVRRHLEFVTGAYFIGIYGGAALVFFALAIVGLGWISGLMLLGIPLIAVAPVIVGIEIEENWLGMPP